jgi:hypothetical protein
MMPDEMFHPQWRKGVRGESQEAYAKSKQPISLLPSFLNVAKSFRRMSANEMYAFFDKHLNNT